MSRLEDLESIRQHALAARAPTDDVEIESVEPFTADGWYPAKTRSGRSAWSFVAWASGRRVPAAVTRVTTYDLDAEKAFREVEAEWSDCDMRNACEALS